MLYHSAARHLSTHMSWMLSWPHRMARMHSRMLSHVDLMCWERLRLHHLSFKWKTTRGGFQGRSECSQVLDQFEPFGSDYQLYLELRGGNGGEPVLPAGEEYNMFDGKCLRPKPSAMALESVPKLSLLRAVPVAQVCSQYFCSRCPRFSLERVSAHGSRSMQRSTTGYHPCLKHEVMLGAPFTTFQ